MKDSKGKTIKVHTDGISGPYILVPKERAEEVRQALFKDSFVLMGDQVEAIINLSQNADVKAVQDVLDSLK
jgi:hypothetical protein